VLKIWSEYLHQEAGLIGLLVDEESSTLFEITTFFQSKLLDGNLQILDFADRKYFLYSNLVFCLS